jgi:hypothetical protein
LKIWRQERVGSFVAKLFAILLEIAVFGCVRLIEILLTLLTRHQDGGEARSVAAKRDIECECASLEDRQGFQVGVSLDNFAGNILKCGLDGTPCLYPLHRVPAETFVEAIDRHQERVDRWGQSPASISILKEGSKARRNDLTEVAVTPFQINHGVFLVDAAMGIQLAGRGRDRW